MKTVMLIGAIVLLVAAAVIWFMGTTLGTVDEDPVLSTKHRLGLIHDRVARWSVENGRLPTSEELVGALPTWVSPTLTMADAWGNAIQYRLVTGEPPCAFAYSVGPDGVDAAARGDDIRIESSVCLTK
jgi:hypothetical protein